MARRCHVRAMPRRSPLDDPTTAAHAWKRYKRLMKAMAALAIVVIAATLGGFSWSNDFLSIHFFIAVALGIGLTIMLTAALMGLLFLSSGTGHDEAVANPDDDDQASVWAGEDRRR